MDVFCGQGKERHIHDFISAQKKVKKTLGIVVVCGPQGSQPINRHVVHLLYKIHRRGVEIRKNSLKDSSGGDKGQDAMKPGCGSARVTGAGIWEPSTWT